MSRHEIIPLAENTCSKLPIKIPRTKQKEEKKYPCFCSREFDELCNEGRTLNLESKSDMQCNSRTRNGHSFVDESTQMSIKNFYDGYILESLLNTNSDIKKYDINVNNSKDLINDTDPLSDIKNILLKTNDKLDMILRKLTDKKDPLRKDSSNRQRRCKLGKCKTRVESSKSSSHVSRPPDQDDQSAEFPTYPRSKCISSTSIPRPRSNPYFIPPYFTPFYSKPISHYNYFKIIGPKYSDPDISNFWSPFLFMATCFNANCIQYGLNNDNAVPSLENGKNNRSDIDKERKERSGDLEQGYNDDLVGVNNKFTSDQDYARETGESRQTCTRPNYYF